METDLKKKSLFLVFIWQKILIQLFPSDLQYLVEMEQQQKPGIW